MMWHVVWASLILLWTLVGPCWPVLAFVGFCGTALAVVAFCRPALAVVVMDMLRCWFVAWWASGGRHRCFGGDGLIVESSRWWFCGAGGRRCPSCDVVMWWEEPKQNTKKRVSIDNKKTYRPFCVRCHHHHVLVVIPQWRYVVVRFLHLAMSR